jgi:group I intron endonuclease
MTIGIYLLKFNNTNKVYIGQSIDIQRRYTTHINDMHINNHSKKLLEAYNAFGEPTLVILEECSLEELNKLENYYIDKYNSYIDGFNSVKEAQSFPVLIGEDNGSAKYLNETIINVMRSLIKYPELTMTEISKISGVHRSTVKNIHNGFSHKWLEKEFPEEYAQLIVRRNNVLTVNTSAQKGIQRPDIVSPTGEVFSNITNIAKFAREQGLNQSALTGVFNGKAKQHKGWKLQ